jgi:hypothetical protein
MRLRDELGIEVSVVTGREARKFHPKLWLMETADGMRVLAGSGNLTAGGLAGNAEQFDAWCPDKDDAKVQLDRFKRLTAGAIPLDRFEGSPGWHAWINFEGERRAVDEQIEALDERLVAEGDLMANLWKLYADMGVAKLKEEDGSTYNRGGFRLVIEGRRGAKTPVAIISSLCRETTPGFERARRNDHLDLAAEVLAVDPQTTYHGLIPEEIRNAAETRLRQAETAGCAPSGV